MAVFPESMDRIDPNDAKKSLSTIESYIRYMQERIEFSQKNTLRTVSEAGVSSAELYAKLVDISNAVQALTSGMASMQGDINSLSGSVTGLQGQITAINGTISGMQTQLSNLEASISNLEARVSALEQAQTTT